MTEPSFDIREHAIFLAGYLDAVGRQFTTESTRVSLTCRYLSRSSDLRAALSTGSLTHAPIERLSHEVGAVLAAMLGISQRSSIGFYLIDYIDWFRRDGDGLKCTRIDSGECTRGKEQEVCFLLEWPNGEAVGISFARTER